MIAESQTHKIVKCSIHDHEYCILTSNVATVLQSSALQTNDIVAGHVVGVVKHDNREIPVFRLDERLGIPVTKSSKKDHIIVLTLGSDSYGLVVEDVSRAINVGENAFSPIPELAINKEKRYFRGICNSARAGDEVDAALVISPAGLIGASEPEILGTSADHDFLKIHSSAMTKQLMTFRLPDRPERKFQEFLALSVTQVLEVKETQTLLPVPGTSKSLLGLTAWRNRFIPVLNLNHILGLPNSTETQRLVIARNWQNKLIGFHASSGVQTLRLPIESQATRPAAEINSSFLSATYLTGQGILMLPDLDKVSSPDAVCLA